MVSGCVRTGNKGFRHARRHFRSVAERHRGARGRFGPEGLPHDQRLRRCFPAEITLDIVVAGVDSTVRTMTRCSTSLPVRPGRASQHVEVQLALGRQPRGPGQVPRVRAAGCRWSSDPRASTRWSFMKTRRGLRGTGDLPAGDPAQPAGAAPAGRPVHHAAALTQRRRAPVDHHPSALLWG